MSSVSTTAAEEIAKAKTSLWNAIYISQFNGIPFLCFRLLSDRGCFSTVIHVHPLDRAGMDSVKSSTTEYSQGGVHIIMSFSDLLHCLRNYNVYFSYMYTSNKS